ncbi:MAG TPA: glycosyltransferase family 4 protein [Nanoarchaeota archaeon]|nr:glycosyltransferase family 4 protein [Nanoarchaeota archaeon]HIH34189.1 glycosyltransferase family 4 protein [Nanoarchaeota archaeon]
MKVAHVTNCYSRQNGVVVAIDEYQSGLNRFGVESIILAPDDSPSKEGVVNVKGTVWNGDCKGYSRNATFTGEIKEVLDDFDIMHIHHISAAFPGIGNPITKEAFDFAKKMGKKIVFHNHTRSDIYFTVYHPVGTLIPLISSEVIRKINVKNCNDADCVIAPSQSIAELLQEWGVKSRIEVVPTSIDFEKFASGNRKRIRADYEIPDETLVVAYIGRISGEKNVLDLLPIAEIPGIKLMFVGDGMQKEKLEKIVRGDEELYGRGRVIFTGQKPYSEIQDYYAAADMIVTASQSETQCLAIWEAHAAGKPVIALDAPGIRDYVQDRANGRLVEYKEELAGVIEILDQHRGSYRNLVEGAKKVTEERKAMKSSAERLLEIYQSLL